MAVFSICNDIGCNNDVIITISWHIEIPGIVRTGISRDIQQYVAMLRHIDGY